jgi:hypothetical protein
MAHGGATVFGIDLSDDGIYLPSTTLSAESPEIDASAHQFVRLQFHRWLNIEDGFFDQARILVNGTEVWKNYAGQSESSSVAHTDREWRFQDIDLKDVAAAAGGKLKIKLELKSDQGLELAGWTVDDVCIVALSGIAAFLHTQARTRVGLAVWGAVGGLATVVALFLGVLLRTSA